IFETGIRYVVNGKPLADMGKINRKCLTALDIKQDVYMAEIRWDLFLLLINNKKIKFKELPRFPEVHRDLALVVDEDIPYATLHGIAFRTEKESLQNVSLFDVYQGKGVPEGKKQYALHLVFRNPHKTLTDAYVEKAVERLLTAFKRETGAVLR
ncbi:MAG: phenylalanine--tRNA ligase subunit beta, partial [Bacteroidales bacterium]